MFGIKNFPNKKVLKHGLCSAWKCDEFAIKYRHCGGGNCVAMCKKHIGKI